MLHWQEKEKPVLRQTVKAGVIPRLGRIRCPRRKRMGRESRAVPHPHCSREPTTPAVYTFIVCNENHDVCAAVLIVPFRFLCHCGKQQLWSSVLEGANGPGGGLKRQPKGSPDQELGGGWRGCWNLRKGRFNAPSFMATEHLLGACGIPSTPSLSTAPPCRPPYQPPSGFLSASKTDPLCMHHLVHLPLPLHSLPIRLCAKAFLYCHCPPCPCCPHPLLCL